MLVPLYGFLRGDSIGLLVLVQDTDTIETVAATLQEAALVRVAPAVRASVYFSGRLLDPGSTVTESGLEALDRIDVVQEL
ncbi:toluene-4-monooxygenase system B family protein [bacterium]|nr:toluene-4-monooxygenase system B family protein [bacterium]